MIIQNEKVEFGNSRGDLRSVAVDILRHLPATGGIGEAKRQVALADELEAQSGDTFEMTPESATLIRSLLDRSQHLPPTVLVAVYDAFDPKPRE